MDESSENLCEWMWVDGVVDCVRQESRDELGSWGPFHSEVLQRRRSKYLFETSGLPSPHWLITAAFYNKVGSLKTVSIFIILEDVRLTFAKKSWKRNGKKCGRGYLKAWESAQQVYQILYQTIRYHDLKVKMRNWVSAHTSSWTQRVGRKAAAAQHAFVFLASTSSIACASTTRSGYWLNSILVAFFNQGSL